MSSGNMVGISRSRSISERPSANQRELNTHVSMSSANISINRSIRRTLITEQSTARPTAHDCVLPLLLTRGTQAQKQTSVTKSRAVSKDIDTSRWYRYFSTRTRLSNIWYRYRLIFSTDLHKSFMASFPVFQVTEGEWTSEKFIDVLGMKISVLFTPDPQLLSDFITNFQTRPDDVFVVTYPKSGEAIHHNVYKRS